MKLFCSFALPMVCLTSALASASTLCVIDQRCEGDPYLIDQSYFLQTTDTDTNTQVVIDDIDVNVSTSQTYCTVDSSLGAKALVKLKAQAAQLKSAGVCVLVMDNISAQ